MVDTGMTHTTDTGAQEVRIKLKPCKSCGGAPEVTYYGRYFGEWDNDLELTDDMLDDIDDIHCAECGLWTGEDMTLRKAIEWWNNQPLIDDLQATITTQATKIQESYSDGWQMGYEKGKRHDFVLINRLEDTIATQAARIAELEKQVAWKEGLIRQLTDVDMPAMEADNERLRAELAAFRGDDWGETVDYLISFAPEPEPPLPEPPDDWDEDDNEDNPHYDTPRGY